MKMSNEKLVARRFDRAVKKAAARIDVERNQKAVQSMEISVEWVKSKTWGMNPHCQAAVWFADGSFERSQVFKCSGCGYDKLSTVLADVFNAYLKAPLWRLTVKGCKEAGVYGVWASAAEVWRDGEGVAHYSGEGRGYSGGIGENCFYRIAEFIGGKLEKLAEGKMYDAYRFTVKEAAAGGGK